MPDVKRIGETLLTSNADVLMDVTQLVICVFSVIQQRAGEWLLKQLNQMKDSDASIHLSQENNLNLEGKIFLLHHLTLDFLTTFENFPDEESLAAFVSRNQREKVRQFIEELLAKLLDGPLDDVSVGQLSTDENCK